MSLKILKVKELNSNKEFSKLNPVLVKPPFLGIFNGSTKSGKSTILTNFIYNPNFYKGVFDKIIFISPTVNNDNTLRFVAQDDDIIKIDHNLDKIDAILEAIVESQKNADSNDRKHILIILDDMLGFIRVGGYLSYLATRYRHNKISLLITSQSFRSIPCIIRVNADFYLISSTANKKEYEKIDEEFSGLIPDFKNLFDKATSKKYDFIYILLKDVVVYHNFDEILYKK